MNGLQELFIWNKRACGVGAEGRALDDWLAAGAGQLMLHPVARSFFNCSIIPDKLANVVSSSGAGRSRESVRFSEPPGQGMSYGCRFTMAG